MKSSLVRGWADIRESRSLLDVPVEAMFDLQSIRHYNVSHDIPPRAAAPRRSAALFKSAFSSRSLSLRAFSRGSRTASESYGSESSEPSLTAFCASFSASFAFKVPFFFGGATTGFTSSDSSSDDSSQSLLRKECYDNRHKDLMVCTHRWIRLFLIFTVPLSLSNGFLHCRRRRCRFGRSCRLSYRGFLTSRLFYASRKCVRKTFGGCYEY